MSRLGLTSEVHEQYVVEYLQFARFRRGQCVKMVEIAFQDLAESRLVEGTFTCDEVREMLSGLAGVVKADVESELITTSHSNILLLRQLLTQAEKWHLKLQMDISQLEDREQLESVAQFELKEFSSMGKLTPTPRHAQLEPLNTSGGDKLLHMEINRLKEENKRLQERVQKSEAKASSALGEKDRLLSDLAARTSLSKDVPPSPSLEGSGEMAALREKIGQLETQLAERKSSDHSGVDEELAKTAHELLRVNAELEQTKKELESKFSDTVQYGNMKKMLSTKNDQIKELRAKLKQYEP